MNHPLTDEICEEITFWRNPCDNMRSAADWQLEQVIEWLEYYPSRYVLQTGGYSALIKDFKEAMRPQEES